MNGKKLSGKGLVIQLSSDKIRIAKTNLGAAMPQLQASFIAELPEGAVEDGVIHDLEAVREILKGALATPDFQHVKRVVFALCTTQVIAEEASLPHMALNKLDKMLEANMDMYFPVDTQNYHLAWQVVDKKNAKDEMVVQLWAVSTNIVRPYYILANSCGLSVVAIDYCGHALATAVDVSFSVPAGEKKTFSAASVLNKPLFSKKKSGETPEEEQAAVAVDDAPASETELYLMAEEEHLLMLFVQNGQVKLQRMALCGRHTSMEMELGEVVMALDYFESLTPGRFNSARCILCGPLAEDESFVMLARDVLNIPVQILPSLHASAWTLCLGAAGTTLDFGVPSLNQPGGVGQINNAWQYGLILVGGAALVLSLATSFGSKSLWTTTVNGLESQKQTLQIQAAQNANYAQNYYNYQGAYQNYSADWDNIFGSIRTYNDNLSLLLDELEDTLPKETSVVEYRIVNPNTYPNTPSLQIADQGLSLELATPTKEQAAYTIIALRELKYADLLDISDLVKPTYEQAPTVGSGQIDYFAMLSLYNRIQNGEDPAEVIEDALEDGTINDEMLGVLLQSKYVNNETAQQLIDEGVITEDRLDQLVDKGIITEDFKDDVLNGTLEPSENDSNSELEDILNGIIGNGELTQESLAAAIYNMTPEQLTTLEQAYAPIPDMDKDTAAKLKNATLAQRQAALSTMLIDDPIGMYRFFKLFETDMNRDVSDAVLHEDIYNDIIDNYTVFYPIMDGDMTALPAVMPELVTILSKDDARLDTVEKLMSEDDMLLKRYNYYLAMEMGILKEEEIVSPLPDPDEIYNDIVNGDSNTGNNILDIIFPNTGDKDDEDITYEDLKDQIMQDILDELLGGGDLSGLLGGNTGTSETTNPLFPNLDDWSSLFPSGTDGSTQYPTQPVDERWHFTVVLGYKPELIAAERERKGLDYDVKIAELEVAE